MKEVRFHGRGGQGIVTAARLLASALFNEGKKVQAFPFFGLERRGAPVQAFLRFSKDMPITTRTSIYTPDIIIIFDKKLLKTADILKGLKSKGLIIINSVNIPPDLSREDVKIATIDATSIALKHLGVPIVNTTVVGAFASATKEVSLSSILKVMNEVFPKDLLTSNIKAVKEGFKQLKIFQSESLSD